MKGLLELSTNNYKTYYYFLKELSKIYPESEFIIISCVRVRRDEPYNLFMNCEEINCEFYHIEDIEIKAQSNSIDYDLLSKIETQYPQRNIWKMIAANRTLGFSYLHGVVWPKPPDMERYTREYILRAVSGWSIEILEIFERFKPDFFMPALAMQSYSTFIYDYACKVNNVPYALSYPIRIKNYFTFATDSQGNFGVIETSYKELLNSGEEDRLSKGRELYDEVTKDIADSKFFGSKQDFFREFKIRNSFRDEVQFWLLTLNNLRTIIISWCRDLVRGHRKSSHSLMFRLLHWVQNRYQNYQLLSPDFGEKLAPDQKYLYFPLHTPLEYSTQVVGTMWTDQFHLVELLSKSVPVDWIVYVKEHPTNLVARTRTWDFYKKISDLPNVKFAPIHTKAHEIISNAEMVAVISGTAGFEAIQRGIPLITFADMFWDFLDLSRRCSNLDTLHQDIMDELERMRAMSPEERKRRLVSFLTVVVEIGQEKSHPLEFSYEPGVKSQYETLGTEMVDHFIKHLAFVRQSTNNSN
jgi:hypothetical protein